jgi:putative hydrolase of the HAD superfamily
MASCPEEESPVAQHFQAAIFDFDNCLCDSREPGEDLFAPAFSAIEEANAGHLSPERLEDAFEECWFTSYDLVAERYDFTRRMYDAGFRAFAKLEVSRALKGYADLNVLRRLPLDKYLVTSGFQRLQQSKLRALDIGGWFTKAVIDAVDQEPHLGKQRIFEEIIAERGYEPARVLAVGDNPLSELDAGRKLGLVTVQTLRPGVKQGDADHHIRSLEELFAILDRRD